MKLGVILIAIAIAAPAMADDIVGQPLEGPFATRDASTALITMCAGGAMATATVIERL